MTILKSDLFRAQTESGQIDSQCEVKETTLQCKIRHIKHLCKKLSHHLAKQSGELVATTSGDIRDFTSRKKNNYSVD